MLIGIAITLGLVSIFWDDLTRLADRVNASRSDYDELGGRGRRSESAEDRPELRNSATATEGRNLIATGDNERNEVLTRNHVLQVHAETIARLLEADTLYTHENGKYKKVGQVAMIRLVTGLAPNGRPDSEYGQIRAELESLLRPTMEVRDGSNIRTIAK